MQCPLIVLLLSAVLRHVSAFRYCCTSLDSVSVNKVTRTSVSPPRNHAPFLHEPCMLHSSDAAALACLCAKPLQPLSAAPLASPPHLFNISLLRTASTSQRFMRRMRKFCWRTRCCSTRSRDRWLRPTLLRIQNSANFLLQDHDADTAPRPAPRSARQRGSPPLFDSAALDVAERARRQASRLGRNQSPAPDPAGQPAPAPVGSNPPAPTPTTGQAPPPPAVEATNKLRSKWG